MLYVKLGEIMASAGGAEFECLGDYVCLPEGAIAVPDADQTEKLGDGWVLKNRKDDFKATKATRTQSNAKTPPKREPATKPKSQ